jgi:hypothetical protein
MRRLAKLSIVALSALALGGSARPTTRLAAADPKITRIRAHVFYYGRGTISDDILAREDFAMSNGFDFGADTAGVAFQGMLVVVEVTGEPRSYPSRQVELAVRTTRGKEIFRRRGSLYGMNAEGKSYVPFFVADVGCTPLEIASALLGQPDPSRKTADVGFHCQE